MRSRSACTVAAFLVVGMFAVACQKTHSDDGGACGAYFDAVVAFQALCGNNPSRGVISTFVGGAERSRFVDYCRHTTSAPGAPADDSALRACAAQLSSDAPVCGATWTTTCALVGTSANGAVCGSDMQCASGWCKGVNNVFLDARWNPRLAPPQATCGVCASPVKGDCTPGDRCITGICITYPSPPPPPGSASGCVDYPQPTGTAGSSCSDGALCVAGLRCRGNVCGALGTLGQNCSVTPECAPPNVCVGATSSGNSGKCTAPQPAGGACTDTECSRNSRCDRGWCFPDTFADPGAVCGVVPGCKIGSCPYDDTGRGICPVVIADGEPCTPGNVNTTCEPWALCQPASTQAGGTCVPLDASLCSKK